ncbi:MAG: nucleotidyltransferase [Bacilli bacterium]|jgi:predicted nucleotidyltransferase|nr:nucleotidyltransferase [Bacilli bacterium]
MTFKKMIVTGIVVEYNPFHNGHVYHIEQARKLTNCDLLIAIMSSTFMQRGEPAILNKFIRTKWALENNIDLVIELPTYYSLQSAEYFGNGAITLLNEFNIDYLCFGSESNDLSNLRKAALINKDSAYQLKVKELMKQGLRYANACNEALIEFNIKPITKSNDILALSYLQAIEQNNFNIKAITIQRTNSFLDTTLSNNTISAQALRKALKEKEDITKYTPVANDINKYHHEIVFLDDYFDLLKYKILTMSLNDLKQIHNMVEGIEYKIKKEINHVNSITELVEVLSSKRYPKTRIQRLLIYILTNITKDEINNIEIDYLRILGMNEKAQKYLRRIKNNTNYHIVTSFSEYQSKGLDLELKISQIYSLAKKDINYLSDKEYKQPVIIYKKNRL